VNKRVKIDFWGLSSERININNIFKDMVDGIEQNLQVHIEDYMRDIRLLGETYESSKRYFKEVYIPLLNWYKRLVTDFIEYNNSVGRLFIDCFGIVVELPTDTDELEAMISELESQLSSLRSERDTIQNQCYSTPGYTNIQTQAALSSIESNISAVKSRIEQIRNFIEKMYLFNTKAASLYAGLEAEFAGFRNAVGCVRNGLKNNQQFDPSQESYWAVDYTLLQLLRQQVKKSMYTADGSLDWDVISEEYSGNRLTKDAVLEELLMYYDFPSDMTFDDFLVYMAINNPNIINNHFSRLIDEDGNWDYYRIGRLFDKEVEHIDGAEIASLIAAFYTMDAESLGAYFRCAYKYEIQNGIIHPEEKMYNHLRLSEVYKKVATCSNDYCNNLNVEYDDLIERDELDAYKDLMNRNNLMNLMYNIGDLSDSFGCASFKIEVSEVEIESETCLKVNFDAIPCIDENEYDFFDIITYKKQKSSYLCVPIINPRNLQLFQTGGEADNSSYVDESLETTISLGKDVLSTFTPVGKLTGGIDSAEDVYKAVMYGYFGYKGYDTPEESKFLSIERMYDFGAAGYYAQSYIDLENDSIVLTKMLHSDKAILENLWRYENRYSKVPGVISIEEVKSNYENNKDHYFEESEYKDFIEWYMSN